MLRFISDLLSLRKHFNLFLLQPTSDELSDEYLKSVLHSVTVVPFVPKNKKIVVDESVSKSDALSEVEESADDLNFDAFAQKIKSFRPKVSDSSSILYGTCV